MQRVYLYQCKDEYKHSFLISIEFWKQFCISFKIVYFRTNYFKMEILSFNRRHFLFTYTHQTTFKSKDKFSKVICLQIKRFGLATSFSAMSINNVVQIRASNI
jgi:hypothetical protein